MVFLDRESPKISCEPLVALIQKRLGWTAKDEGLFLILLMYYIQNWQNEPRSLEI